MRELEAELRGRGLPTTGKKADLIARLSVALDAEGGAGAGSVSAGGDGCDPVCQCPFSASAAVWMYMYLNAA